jgi:SAM-dependent methyltransferase
MSPRLGRILQRAAPESGDPAASTTQAAAFTRTVAPRPDADRTPITDMLYGRLTAEDIAQVEASLTPQDRWSWDHATPAELRRITLSFGLMHHVPGVIEHTGLSPATPPPEIHSMVHGWTTEIGGSYYLADMVYDAMREIDDVPAGSSRVLDFSCSSGRVIRPLAAALPEARWHGCDPNAPAIAWMRDNVPAVDVQVSPTTPPLQFEDASLDLVFAISVWSHYSAAGALRWLSEIHRVLRPGGHLLLTTHGLQACVWFSIDPNSGIEVKLGADWIDRSIDRLTREGHCFWDVFGEAGDWGVVDPEWGLALFTPEWLLEQITPQWALRTYRVGAAHGNQDLYLLQRQ